MSYLDWHVGMKVVCVDNSDGAVSPNNGRLKLGEVYTVTCIEPDAFPVLAIQVDGLGLRHWEFLRASRFRPVQTRNTDISCFTKMLVPTKKREVA